MPQGSTKTKTKPKQVELRKPKGGEYNNSLQQKVLDVGFNRYGSHLKIKPHINYS